MITELATVRRVEKPWGVSSLGHWAASTYASSDRLVGELCFERSIEPKRAELLLKVLLTSKVLSVQVHPDDAYARSIGLPNGKTEAWYILSAEADAKVAVGLTARLARSALRAAISDGSIETLLAWQSVAADDVLLIPAGTIHAIGAGIVLVEVQQNSDTTFRILDRDHGRPLHIDHAVAAARTAPAEFQLRPERVSAERSLLVSTSHFVLERIELPPHSEWSMRADQETWIYCLSGTVIADEHALAIGSVVVAEASAVEMHVGGNGVACLVAYPGGDGPTARLLTRQKCAPDDAAHPYSVHRSDARKD